VTEVPGQGAEQRAAGTVGLCIVISTVGRRPERFVRLLDALAAQTDPDFVVGVCDQSTGEDVSALLERFDSRLHLYLTRSAAGLSAGRNSVAAAAPDQVTHFAFPNDTTIPAEDFVARVRSVAGGYDVVACDYRNDGGSRYRLPPPGEMLTRRNVWKVLEPAMILRRDVWSSLGGFDEMLGTGAPTPYQSGEGTDLLLRGMTDRRLRVRWAPDIALDGVSEAYGITPKQVAEKARAYGRGYGFVVARHGYPWTFRIPHLVAPAVKAALRLEGHGLRAALAASAGRVEGVLGQRREEWRR
jgi:hypothetical protein